MLKDIFSSHTKTQDYHLEVSQLATLIVKIKIILHLNKLLMLTNGIILAVSGHDTLRPLDNWLGPSQVVYVKLTTINGAI